MLFVETQFEVLAQVPVEVPGPAGNGRRAYWPRKVAIFGWGEALEQVMDQFCECVHQLQLELPNWHFGYTRIHELSFDLQCKSYQIIESLTP